MVYFRLIFLQVNGVELIKFVTYLKLGTVLQALVNISSERHHNLFASLKMNVTRPYLLPYN